MAVTKMGLSIATVPALSGAPAGDAIDPRQGIVEKVQGLERPSPNGLQAVRISRVNLTLGMLAVADALAIGAALIAGGATSWVGGRSGGYLFGPLVFEPLVLAIMAVYGLYRRGRRRLLASAFPDLGPLLHALLVSCLLIVLCEDKVASFSPSAQLGREGAAVFGVTAMVAVPALRATFRYLSNSLVRGKPRVLIVGSGLVASSVARRISATRELDVVGYVDDEPFSVPLCSPGVAHLGQLNEIPRLLVEREIDHLVVAFTPVEDSELAALLRSLADRVRISIVPRMFDLLTVRSVLDDLCGLPVIDVAPPSLGLGARLAKRTMDVLVSGAALLVLCPVMVLIAAVVRLSSPGPALFRQKRTGRNGRNFDILKFRTMYQGAEAQKAMLRAANEVDGPLFKIRSDPRVTPVGAFLRKTSLDELPQLINVLKGDMSLVGPRPFVVEESREIRGWAARRFSVRPGMTGLWQISGRNDLPFEDLSRLDYCYVASWSLWWDLRIIWHTPASVLARRGAY